MVGISHTTLPTSHLKPLGQVSMLIHSTDFPFFCQQKSQKSAIFSKRPFLSSNATGPISDVPFSSSLLSVRKTALFQGCCLSESCFRIHRRSRIRSDTQGLQHFHDLAFMDLPPGAVIFIVHDVIAVLVRYVDIIPDLLLIIGSLPGRIAADLDLLLFQTGTAYAKRLMIAHPHASCRILVRPEDDAECAIISLLLYFIRPSFRDPQRNAAGAPGICHFRRKSRRSCFHTFVTIRYDRLRTRSQNEQAHPADGNQTT